MPQNIFKLDYLQPETLESSDAPFLLVPTDRRLSRLDYEAVMASREFLRDWGGDTWPADEFTEHDNFSDLKYHVYDNLHHRAYGYMILSGDKSRVLGSVYVNPLGTWPKYHKLVDGNDPVKEYDARIDYWVRTDEPRLEDKVLPALKEWFVHTWKIKALVVTRESFTERNRVIADLKLLRVAEFESLKNPRKMQMHSLA